MKGKVEQAPINKMAALNAWRETADRLQKEAMKLKPDTLRQKVAALKIGQ